MSSFTYFTSQTNVNSNQEPPAEFYDHSVIMIALVVIVYLSTPQNHFLY